MQLWEDPVSEAILCVLPAREHVQRSLSVFGLFEQAGVRAGKRVNHQADSPAKPARFRQ